ncbi:MAG TPA: helix-turn-helix transcriptional regulator [Gammaproteobacteria bacterium]
MDMSVDREFVRRLRLNKSWSQEKLADEAGVSLRTVQRIEADGVASHRSCRVIAEALGVAPAELRHGGSTPDQVQPSGRSLETASPWRFVLLRAAQALVVSVLWLLMAFVALNAFIVLIGGIFFWEYAEVPDLTAPQAAGGGTLTAAVLALFYLGLRWVYRTVRETKISRVGSPEIAVE